MYSVLMEVKVTVFKPKMLEMDQQGETHMESAGLGMCMCEWTDLSTMVSSRPVILCDSILQGNAGHVKFTVPTMACLSSSISEDDRARDSHLCDFHMIDSSSLLFTFMKSQVLQVSTECTGTLLFPCLAKPVPHSHPVQ